MFVALLLQLYKNIVSTVPQNGLKPHMGLR